MQPAQPFYISGTDLHLGDMPLQLRQPPAEVPAPVARTLTTTELLIDLHQHLDALRVQVHRQALQIEDLQQRLQQLEAQTLAARWSRLLIWLRGCWPWR